MLDDPIKTVNEETITITMNGYETAALAQATLKRVEYFQAHQSRLTQEEWNEWHALHSLLKQLASKANVKVAKINTLRQDGLN